MVIQEQVDERIVAFFDMLGMSELSLHNPGVAWEALSDLTAVKDELLNFDIEILGTSEVIRDRIKVLTFSDSFVAFSFSNQIADVYAILILCSEIFSNALNSCVPLRGAIAHGHFLFNSDQDLFAGPPLVNAYRQCLNSQWLGIMVDTVVAEKAMAVPLQSKRKRSVITDWEVSLKSGKGIKTPVIDWVETRRDILTVQPPLTVPQFYQAFETMFGSYDDLPRSIQNKYQNTVAFINDRLT